ncbi:26055_t:CDS:2, partial [Gigaspora margarita]
LTFTQSSSQTTHQHPAPEHQQPTTHSRPNMMKIDNDPAFNTPTRATTSATQLTKRPPTADQETNTPEQSQTNPKSNNQP